MQSIEINGLAELDAKLQAILKELPEARRQLHERLAEMAKKEVDAQIDASGLNDSHGKIKGWQEAHVGSGGGYAAVRPQKGMTGDNSPGAITNYLENGHRIREPLVSQSITVNVLRNHMWTVIIFTKQPELQLNLR